MDDRYYTQTHYSMCGGVERAELNIMEVEFLQLLGWKARVDVDELRHNLIEAMEWTLAATHNNDHNNYNHDAFTPRKNNNSADNSRFLNTALSGDAESLKCPDLSGDLSPMASGF